MKKKLLFFCLSFFTFIFTLNAQTTDLARIEFLRIPFSNGNQSLNRFRGLAQLPIPLNEEDFLVIGGEYRKLDLDFDDRFPFETSTIESTQRIETTVGYIRKIRNSNWRIAVKTGMRIASNFQTTLGSDDFIFLSAIYAINDVKNTDENGVALGKPYRIIFGLIYTTTPGRNYPIPLLNYFREIDENWSYTAGVPKSLLRYSFNEKDHLQTFATLDGFFANIQEDIVVEGKNRIGQNISMTNVTLGLGYEHYFTEHILYYLYAGHTIYNEYRIRNNNRDDVFVIENDNAFYVRTGIKLKI